MPLSFVALTEPENTQTSLTIRIPGITLTKYCEQPTPKMRMTGKHSIWIVSQYDLKAADSFQRHDSEDYTFLADLNGEIQYFIHGHDDDETT